MGEIYKLVWLDRLMKQATWADSYSFLYMSLVSKQTILASFQPIRWPSSQACWTTRFFQKRGPHSLLFNGYQELFPCGVKLPDPEADHLPPSSVEVENEWSYTSTPQYAFMAWYLV